MQGIADKRRPSLEEIERRMKIAVQGEHDVLRRMFDEVPPGYCLRRTRAPRRPFAVTFGIRVTGGGHA